jgi:hypothetical protein
MWCVERDRIQGAATDKLVVLGASRVEMGFVVSAFDRLVPGMQAVQLGIAGDAPLAMLRSFAEDEDFRGVILCSLEPDAMFPERWEEQADEALYYRTQWGPSKYVAHLLARQLQRRFVFVSPALGWLRVCTYIARGESPRPPIHTVLPDRTRVFNLDRLNVDAETKWRVQVMKDRARRVTPPTPEELQWVIAEISNMVNQLHTHGAHVIFVIYWDVFAAAVPAPSIHYADYPEVAGMKCVEGSHLSYDDAVRFTEFLVKEMNSLGLLSPDAPR